jgi:MerR family redox-sensitive transcriptional activator SoxR
MAEPVLLPIAEITHRSGFAASALRFYEKEGLIWASRSGGGQRRYERSVLRRLAFIRAARNVGLSLDEIRTQLADLPSSRTPTKADWQRISRHWRARLDEQIAAIEALRDRLDGCIGCGCLSLRSCSLYNPNDVIGTFTTGAGRLPERLRQP